MLPVKIYVPETTGFVWTYKTTSERFTHSVKVLNSNNNFSNIYSNFVFSKLLSLVQMGEKFSAIHVIYELQGKTNIKVLNITKYTFEIE